METRDPFDDETKLLAFKEQWRNAKIESAELVLGHSKVPEIREGYEWPPGVADITELPDEAFTGRSLDVYTLGWKWNHNGKQYGNYLELSDPSFNLQILSVLRTNFEQAKKEIEGSPL